MKSLAEIKAIVDGIAERIGARPYTLPTYGEPGPFGHAHVMYDGLQYHYVEIPDRGYPVNLLSTKNIDDLIYRIFVDVTARMVPYLDLPPPGERQDKRHVWQAKQVELMHQVDPAMGARFDAEKPKLFPHFEKPPLETPDIIPLGPS